MLRQQQRDLEWLAQRMRDLNQQQSQLFFLINTFLVGYDPPALQPLIDDDVVEAAGALAATFETSARGVIYEHHPASFPAERLTAALKSLLAEIGQKRGTSFERDAAVVLRRIEEASRGVRDVDQGNRRVFLDLLGRVIGKSDEREPSHAEQVPRLIVP